MSVTSSKVTALVNALTAKFALSNHTHSGYVSATKVTSWSSTTSDSNVPSEKLVKDSLDDKIAKSSTSGLVKNDGTVDTSSYITSSSLPTKTSDLTNDGDGTNAFLTQHQSLSDYVKNRVEIEATQQNPLDLNDYVTSGFYTATPTEAGYIANTPTDNRFTLLVERSDANFIKQTFSDMADKVIYVRYRTYSSGWGNWVSIPMSTDSRLSDARDIYMNTVDSSTTTTTALNDYNTKSALYFFYTGSGISRITNKPSELTVPFYLLVERYTSAYLKQTITRYSDGVMWVRTKTGGSTWTDWEQIATMSDVEDLVGDAITYINQ